MTRLRKLGEEMKPTPVSTDVPSTSVAPSQTTKIRAAVSAPRPDDHERRERERLDKELELHHASLVVEGGVEESTEDLKAKLERLKAEAASLGLPEATAESSYGGGSYRPYRGRGRGVRSYYRGAARGGPPRASMKLDNRPKKLLIKGVSDNNVQAVRDWYEVTGQMESVETTEGGIVVTFRSRGAAEQGLAKGHNIPTIGPIKVSWFSGQQSNAYTAYKSTSPLVASKDDKMTERHQARSPDPEPLLSPHTREEEVVASGWGGDGEEDGMGML